MIERRDAIVVGSGPNGLAAAIALALAGRSVLVLEAARRRSAAGRARPSSRCPASRTTSARRSIRWRSRRRFSAPAAARARPELGPPAELPLAHPLDDGTAVALDRSVARPPPASGADAAAYRRLMRAARRARRMSAARRPARSAPRRRATRCALARFGLPGAPLGDGPRALAASTEPAPGAARGQRGALDAAARPAATAALRADAGCSATPSAGRLPRGGSQRSPTRWRRYLRSLGGEIETGAAVRLARRAAAGAAPCCSTSRRARSLAIAGDRLPARYRRALGALPLRPRRLQARLGARRAGAVDGRGVPRAGTVHLGGTLEEIAAAEAEVAHGGMPERPFVLVAQQSLFDPDRAPRGQHTLWAYCHVPNGSARRHDRGDRAQIERFAPGFRDRDPARAHDGPGRARAHNPNYVGGDINGGAQTSASCSRGPVARPVPTRRPTRASSSARRPPRPAAASTGCAAITRRAPRCAERCAETCS